MQVFQDRHRKELRTKAQALLDGLADTGIDALIDEATGYQSAVRLMRFKKFLLLAFGQNQSKFPISFYEQIHRVMG
jgi:hypothetical protein